MNMFNKKKKDKQKTEQDPSAPIVNKIKEADKGVLILSKNGHVEVIGVKNTNFALEAKGLIRAALDVYLARDVMRLLSQDIRQLQGQMGQIARLFAPQPGTAPVNPEEAPNVEPPAQPEGPQPPKEAA